MAQSARTMQQQLMSVWDQPALVGKTATGALMALCLPHPEQLTQNPLPHAHCASKSCGFISKSTRWCNNSSSNQEGTPPSPGGLHGVKKRLIS